MPIISEETFAAIAKPKLGGAWKDSLIVFRVYGTAWAFDIMLALLHAADKEKVRTVLRSLRKHAIRNPDLDPEKTKAVFSEIYSRVLKLDPLRHQPL